MATGCGQIKTGSIPRSDRTAKVQPADPHRANAGRAAQYAGTAILKGRT
ncbi:hypothetical protein ACU4GD_11535 [Cupriavidus basilensis]